MNTSNERANAAHGAKEQRGGGLFFSTRRGVSVFGCPHCPYSGRFVSRACIASTRRPSVSILSTLSIFGRRLDAAPPRRAVLRLSGFGLLLHEKDGAGDTSNERANAAHGSK